MKIIAPTSAFDGGEKKKVIVWIHGGTFNFGGMDVQYEDPTPLVEEQDIIVRVFNQKDFLVFSVRFRLRWKPLKTH